MHEARTVISARREGIWDEAVAAAGLASHPRTEGAEEAEVSGPALEEKSRPEPERGALIG